MKAHRNILIICLISFLSFGCPLSWSEVNAQSRWQRLAEEEGTLGLENGFIEAEAGGFVLKLVKESQTIASLSPKADKNFDFTPSEMLEVRKGKQMYHLGDLNLRIRNIEDSEWMHFSSASDRQPVKELKVNKDRLIAAADITATFSENIPLKIERYWTEEEDELILKFRIENVTDKPVEIGSFGIPMIFNNILHDKSLEEAHAESSFHDPYIGQDAGYLQVVRLHGHGPVLLVLPCENTPFEAYNPLLDDRTPRGITFEGFYEWMTLSKAYAQDEWKEADPWNRPRSVRMNPGDVKEFGVRFLLAPSIREIENTLIKHGQPVALGIPGYVVPKDVKASLYLKHSSEIIAMDVEPGGALKVEKESITEGGWNKFRVEPLIWGRARLTVTYKDGLKQSIHYKVIKPEEEIVADMGKFLTNEQWYDNPEDPFNRHLSVISYDYGKMEQVDQDSRSWVAGLSDEGGAGSWLAAMMKQLIQPDKDELEKMEQFVSNTLWGGIQYSEGEKKYGVRKSMFYYDPDNMPEGTYSDKISYRGWSAWPPKEALSTGRSYNYPHVAAAWWVMYQLKRNHKDLVKEGTSEWYLEQAYNTGMAMVDQAPHYAQFGQMEGTIFILILLDLKREGMDDLAEKFEAKMRSRADLWKSLKYPFGSEMPWDSTGQEEVYMWSKYFGNDEKAGVTLNAILAYMPAVPHWGYNGSARRYWDFQYAGKLKRVERQLHHYGSPLNAIPVLNEYREHPDDFYLLRVGHAGMMGALSNITPEGFGPSAFHAYPSTLREDHLSGDYGSGFFGYAVNNSSYLTQHKEFGWVSFGGNIVESNNEITLIPTTSSRSRVFIAPAGLWLTLDAGKFRSVKWNSAEESITIEFDEAKSTCPEARLRIEQTASVDKTYKAPSRLKSERDALVIPLEKTRVVVLK